MKIKKILIIHIVALILLVLLFFVISTPGLLSQNSCFEYEDLPDELNDGPGMIITDYNDNKYCSKDVIVPNEINGKPVIEIAEGAFFKKGLQSVKLPDGLKYIGAAAFSFNFIDSVTIPKSVVAVYDFAFYKNYMTEVIFEDGVELILDHAFSDNEIESVIIPESVMDIEYGAFRDNPLQEVIIERVVNVFENNWESIGFPIELLP